MDIIEDLIGRVRSFDKDLEDGTIMSRIVRENDAYIIDINTEQLYKQGVNALGVRIKDYAPYSPITIQIKRMKGQPTNRVTLKDEGDFYSSFFIEVDNEGFEIKAKDWKTDHLVRKYGQIFGLTEKNLQKVIKQYILPDILDEAKKRLYGKKSTETE